MLSIFLLFVSVLSVDTVCENPEIIYIRPVANFAIDQVADFLKYGNDMILIVNDFNATASDNKCMFLFLNSDGIFIKDNFVVSAAVCSLQAFSLVSDSFYGPIFDTSGGN